MKKIGISILLMIVILVVLIFGLGIIGLGESPVEYEGVWYSDKNPDKPLIICDDNTYISEELTNGTWTGPNNSSIKLKSEEGVTYTLERRQTSNNENGHTYSAHILFCSMIGTSYYRSQTTAEQTF